MMPAPTEIDIAHISVSERRRLINPQTVTNLVQSIEQHGLLQPIGVKIKDRRDRYELIFGLHRLEAVKVLQRKTIPASVFPSDLSAEECLLLEMRENLDRNDLTGAQRKAFTGEVAHLIAKLNDGNSIAIGNDRWFVNLATETGIATKTMYNWWSEFCVSAGLKLTPKQAVGIHQAQFFSWLTDHVEHEKVEKQRKAEAAEAKKREAAAHALRAALDKAADEFGIDTVRKWLEGWLTESTV